MSESAVAQSKEQELANLKGKVLREILPAFRASAHAAMVVSLAKQGGINSLADHSTTVRRFIRGFLKRETDQASAPVIRTNSETKELVLARLAFETKRSNQAAFSRITARSILTTAKVKAGATSLDVSRFLEEIRDNHLLERADGDAIEFAHELYHDYFAATELETREQMQAGLGVEFALSNFSKVHWSECVRLFAGFSNSSRILIQRGAEKNPFLAWQLLRDASDETSELVERVSEEAYCALSTELKSASQAAIGHPPFSFPRVKNKLPLRDRGGGINGQDERDYQD